MSEPDVSEPRLVELTAAQTHPLRLEVLRRGTPNRDVAFAGDELPSTLHLGAELDGDVVAVSTWLDNPHPDLPDRRAMQLRGMATAGHVRGRGIGGLIVEAGLERVFAAGYELVWARARDSALGFYERHGFVIRGDGYVDVNTLIPHHDIVITR